MTINAFRVLRIIAFIGVSLILIGSAYAQAAEYALASAILLVMIAMLNIWR